jgi:hypothetical protein
MASESILRGICNSYSFIGFLKAFGPDFEVGQFVRKEDGHSFKTMRLTNERGEKTTCYFSGKLGELSDEEIVRRRKDLQVVQCLNDAGLPGNYFLCNNGEQNFHKVIIPLD